MKKVLAVVVVFTVSAMVASSVLAFGGPPPSTNIVSNEAIKSATGETQSNSVVTTPETAPKAVTGQWYKVRVGIFSHKDGAESLKMKLAGEGYSAFLVQQAGLWRVQVGAFKEKTRAEELTKELSAKGFQPDIIVIY